MNSIAALLIAAAITLPPQAESNIASDSVDLIELNHYYDECGKLVFDQIIFFDWHVNAGRYQVRAWRLVKSECQVPHYDWQQGRFVVIWTDGDLLRKVTSRFYRESWTQPPPLGIGDPELVERAMFPKNERIELFHPKQFTPR